MNKKEAMSFLHDSNARNDMRILELRLKYGWEGYGLYFAIVEILREQTDYKLKLNYEKVLTMQLQPLKVDINNLINDCIKIELFKTDNDCFWSESLLNRMNAFNEVKRKMSEGGKKGMTRRYKGVVSGLKGSYKVTKRKETKQKEIKLNKTKGFQKPIIETLIMYFQERGWTGKFGETQAEIFIDHFNSNGWKVGGKAPMKDWKASVRNWIRREENKKPNTGPKSEKPEPETDDQKLKRLKGMIKEFDKNGVMTDECQDQNAKDKYKIITSTIKELEGK